MHVRGIIVKWEAIGTVGLVCTAPIALVSDIRKCQQVAFLWLFCLALLSHLKHQSVNIRVEITKLFSKLNRIIVVIAVNVSQLGERVVFQRNLSTELVAVVPITSITILWIAEDKIKDFKSSVPQTEYVKPIKQKVSGALEAYVYQFTSTVGRGAAGLGVGCGAQRAGRGGGAAERGAGRGAKI